MKKDLVIMLAGWTTVFGPLAKTLFIPHSRPLLLDTYYRSDGVRMIG